MEDETARQLPAFEARMMAVIMEMRTEIRERLTAIEGEVAATRQAFHTRLTALEEKVDSRLRAARPIWEGIKAQLDRVESKLEVFATDTSALLLETRTDISQVRKRVSQLETSER